MLCFGTKKCWWNWPLVLISPTFLSSQHAASMQPTFGIRAATSVSSTFSVQTRNQFYAICSLPNAECHKEVRNFSAKMPCSKFWSNQTTDIPDKVFQNHHGWTKASCGLYYKHVTIVNYSSCSVNKLRASLNDDARVIIYDYSMFIVQATDFPVVTNHGSINSNFT
jgi:hypothetical protein